jgi:isopenicillin-N epimerase
MTDLRSQFLLDPSVTFLNFGSFGACPRPVFEAYQRWQLELEREPVAFLARNAPSYLRQSREALGGFVGCNADDLVYVPNPSYAVNIVAKSFGLKAGDEVLSTDIEYGACDKAWQVVCAQTSAEYVRSPITLPVTTSEKIVEDLFKRFTPRTRLIFVSHITSATALILPVEKIVNEAKARGVPVFIDGAHAPAHVALDLQKLDADFYTGACHKWMMAPKGSSFLYVRREMQAGVAPLVVSWGYAPDTPLDTRFVEWHQGQGTRDISPFLSIPAALQFMKEHNWSEVATQCRKLVADNAKRFCDLAGTAPIAPPGGPFTGQMYSVRLNTTEPEALGQTLFEKYAIEVPVMRHGELSLLRYSINGFNSQEDLDNLYQALKNEL